MVLKLKLRTLPPGSQNPVYERRAAELSWNGQVMAKQSRLPGDRFFSKGMAIVYHIFNKSPEKLAGTFRTG